MGRKLTHPADGLFYLNRSMLARIHMCDRWRTFLLSRMPPNGRLRITLRLLCQGARRSYSSPAHVSINGLVRFKKLTEIEARRFFAQSCQAHGLNDRCRAVMDALLQAARKQGLIQ